MLESLTFLHCVAEAITEIINVFAIQIAYKFTGFSIIEIYIDTQIGFTVVVDEIAEFTSQFAGFLI